tara:strand:+ start:454 stop:822 length:369 start_codon:yes stop_codon:yes gene_type:complete
MVNVHEWYNTIIVEGEDGKSYEKYTRTDAKLNKDFASINSSVNLINNVITRQKIGGDGYDKDNYVFMNNSTEEERKDRVKLNYEFLETMVSKTDWDGSSDYTAPDLTNAKKAITDGKAYVGE